ncbi:hypothetical protein MPC4_50014 [Methylocella tundrae]|uniref:Helix-turn-helix domain-containing protein n=1 Tax=Methylocella tundrae TaxID=227605 RepID=A0A8B6MCH6_METTU|nr:hypothetical protein MPC1_1380002 [Methylocella tundrae]VTZ51706.1 hypothetical protein MPC4_50014 [Methylocella tundrae]
MATIPKATQAKITQNVFIIISFKIINTIRGYYAFLSVRRAARLSGKSKSTILRAIRSGRLSARRTDQGAYAVDPADLCRVYPAANTPIETERFRGQNAEELVSANESNAIAPESVAEHAKVESKIGEARDRCRARAEHTVLTRSTPERRPWWVAAFSSASSFSRALLSGALACRARLIALVE